MSRAPDTAPAGHGETGRRGDGETGRRCCPNSKSSRFSLSLQHSPPHSSSFGRVFGRGPQYLPANRTSSSRGRASGSFSSAGAGGWRRSFAVSPFLSVSHTVHSVLPTWVAIARTRGVAAHCGGVQPVAPLPAGGADASRRRPGDSARWDGPGDALFYSPRFFLVYDLPWLFF